MVEVIHNREAAVMGTNRISRHSNEIGAFNANPLATNNIAGVSDGPQQAHQFNTHLAQGDNQVTGVTDRIRQVADRFDALDIEQARSMAAG